MDEVLFGVLAENVGRYLESIERLAATAQTGPADELRRLAAAWRALLDIHRPTGRRGQCAGCDPRRLAMRQRGMCTVWRVANAFFVRALPDER